MSKERTFKLGQTVYVVEPDGWGVPYITEGVVNYVPNGHDSDYLYQIYTSTGHTYRDWTFIYETKDEALKKVLYICNSRIQTYADAIEAARKVCNG